MRLETNILENPYEAHVDDHWRKRCAANPNTGTMEFALRDPDGYYVMVSALEADRRSTSGSQVFGPSSFQYRMAILKTP